MKIEGVSSSIAAQNKKAEKIAASGFSLPAQSATNGATGSNAAHAPMSMAHLSSLGSLLALQAEDTTEMRRKRAVTRADNLLDQLDDLRVATLSGRISHSQISKLAESLRERLDMVDDPNLQQILDDIELRAEVELAKLEQNL